MSMRLVFRLFRKIFKTFILPSSKSFVLFSFSVKNLLADVKSANNQNQIIYREVRRITLVSSLNVQTLDPFVIAKMNNISNELKVRVAVLL